LNSSEANSISSLPTYHQTIWSHHLVSDVAYGGLPFREFVTIYNISHTLWQCQYSSFKILILSQTLYSSVTISSVANSISSSFTHQHVALLHHLYSAVQYEDSDADISDIYTSSHIS
jgi:hypothetical protein